MSEDQAPYNKMVKAKDSGEKVIRSRKKPMIVSDVDSNRIKLIATKAKELRVKSGYSYEEFALRAGINRNSYFRFEKSADTGDNYTVALLMKVISGLGTTPAQFFKNIQ